MLVHVWWDNDIVYFCVFLRLPFDIHIDDMHVWMFIIAVNYTSTLLRNALNWLGRKVMYTQVIHLFGRIPTLYQNTHINWFNLYHFNNIVIHVYKRYQLYQVLQHKGYKMTVPSFNCDTLKILKWWLLVIINVIKVFECCTFQFFHFFFFGYMNVVAMVIHWQSNFGLVLFNYRFVIKDKDTFFTHAQRSKICYEILSRAHFLDLDDDDDKFNKKFGKMTDLCISDDCVSYIIITVIYID